MFSGSVIQPVLDRIHVGWIVFLHRESFKVFLVLDDLRMRDSELPGGSLVESGDDFSIGSGASLVDGIAETGIRFLPLAKQREWNSEDLRDLLIGETTHRDHLDFSQIVRQKELAERPTLRSKLLRPFLDESSHCAHSIR